MSEERNSSAQVLVLGAGGFLGRHLVDAFGARALPGTRPSAALGPQDLAADLCDPERLSRLLEATAPSAVINCAALAAPAACEEEPAAAVLLNVELPRLLGEWGGRTRARVVHVSTDLVFGAEPAPKGGFGEEDEPAPVSVYGVTKAAGESALLERDPEALVVRLPLLYGDSHGRARGASDDLFAQLLEGERPALFTDEWRTPLPVSVAAEALVELVDQRTSGKLHVAGAERVSRMELGVALCQQRFGGSTAAVQELRGCLRGDLDLSPPRPEDTSLCIQRAQALLETELPNLAEGVRLAIGAP